MIEQRRPPLRSRALLDLAHELHRCTLAIPGVCQGFAAEGLEPAHGPKSLLGGGVGQKPDDVFAAACHACHAEIDQGKSLTREERRCYWLTGCARTWAELMRTGKLKVAA